MQADKVLRDGENVLSRAVTPIPYGEEVTEVMLPRKALTTLTNYYLYPKPTQVGE